jgi:hypothetical protein
MRMGPDLMALRITRFSLCLFITRFLFGGVCSCNWYNLRRIAWKGDQISVFQ